MSVSFRNSNEGGGRSGPDSIATEAKRSLDALPDAKVTAIPFTSLGLRTRDTLYGSRGVGIYTFDHRAGFMTRTSTGTVLTGTAIQYNGVLQTSLTGSHSLSNGVNLVASATSTGLLGLDVTSKVAPGLLASFSHSAITSSGRPAYANRLGFEYANSYVHAKGTVSAEREPEIKVAMASGLGDFQLGLDLNYSTGKAIRAAREARAQAHEQLQTKGMGVTDMQRATSAGTAGAPASVGATQVPAARQAPTAPGTPPLHHTHSAPPQATGATAAVPAVPAAAPAVGVPGDVRAKQRAYERSAFSAAALVGGLTSWSAVLGWRRGAHEVTYTVTDLGTAPVVLGTRLGYAFTVRNGVSLAAEVAQDMPVAQTKSRSALPPFTYSIGAAARVSALYAGVRDADIEEHGTTRVSPHKIEGTSQALVKVKIDSNGYVSALYSDKFKGTKTVAGLPSLQITWTAQINTLRPFAAYPRVGINMELA